MDQYYYIVSSSFGGLTKKLTYKQYIAFMQNHVCQCHKVLKSDWNTLEKSLKGVSLANKTEFIFNRLHMARKTSGVY